MILKSAKNWTYSHMTCIRCWLFESGWKIWSKSGELYTTLNSRPISHDSGTWDASGWFWDGPGRTSMLGSPKHAAGFLTECCWQAPHDSQWHGCRKTMPGPPGNCWNLSYFWFCSEQVRLTEASKLAMRMDANSFALPVPPPPLSPPFLCQLPFLL